MNGMTAGHFMRRTSGTEQEFLTDRTVGFVLSAFAVVVGVQAFVDAHSTVVAMLEIFSASDTTKPTILAMIGLFIVGHP